MSIVAEAVSGAIGPAFKLIDELFTSDDEREAAKLKLLQQKDQTALKELETAMSAIVMEAQSKDPWTSRARPTFFYVMYLFILAAIPIAVLSMYRPDLAGAFADGLNAYLDAIPSELYSLFGAGYLGYSGMRTWEKGKGVTK